MSKYRFKTEEEFKENNLWNNVDNVPFEWSECQDMNTYMGKIIEDTHTKQIDLGRNFNFDGWYFQPHDCVEITQLSLTEILETIKLEKTKQNPLIIKTKQMKNLSKSVSTAKEKFVFMDKTEKVLEIGYNTGKNVVLYGPGGHGKSEMTLEFLNDRGITPYVMVIDCLVVWISRSSIKVARSSIL